MARIENGIEIFETTPSGLIVSGRSVAALPTTAGIFAVGATILGVDGKSYRNAGTTASPSWQDEDSISTSEIADGAITAIKINTASIGTVVRGATATADGTGTGTLTAGSQYTVVTSSAANKQIILPAPVIGTQIILNVGANGFDLLSSAPATVGINGGVGAGKKSPIAANSTCFLTCISATAWTGFFTDSVGAPVKIVAAA